ncbi:rhomboid family intramembrane serine protease [Danxiaibacter flavus]|uniref:Rhomboid family intramembrane serine protease n=1 Tax=Danxiaibacter flavus TaxID=3049108 RepID=A0ABV3ZK87_9BACT|nr:rhomboid family intramembrane serine protease [Chitinophagaceae bacterium DXS]
MSEFRPGGFQILPYIIKNLIIINVLIFLAQQTFGAGGNTRLEDLFALHTWQSSLFKPWQFVTYMFMHGSWGHIFWNMFAVWMFGAVLENLWGPKRFLTFYVVCGLGAALAHMIVLYFENQGLIKEFNSLSPMDKEVYYTLFVRHLNSATLGASGAVFGCLAAFGYLFPNRYISIYFLFPIKAKWFVIIYAGIELFSGIKNSAGDNVAHFAHLGGGLVGIILVYYWNKTNRHNFY